MKLRESFHKALLSEASYADLSNRTNEQTYIDALVAGGFSPTQASQFTDPATGYTILSQSIPIANGFSATLFRNNSTGEKTLAIRGSDDGFDFVTDAIDIAYLGTAELQSQYQSLEAYYDLLLAQGLLEVNETFSVSGHSLGGFLAQAFSINYTEKVNSTYTYNAPGFAADASEVLQALHISGSLEVPGMTNLFAEQGPEVAAGLGQMLGGVVGVYVEDQSGLIGALKNHSIKLLTDSLAIYNLLVTLDQNLTPDQITVIMEAASNESDKSLEAIVNALGDLFSAGVKVTTDNRDELYTRIQAIQGKLPLYPNIALTALHDDAPQAIAIAARSDKGFLYALEHLNPFAVVGDDSLYTNLDPADFSDAYLEDRSSLLKDKLSRAIQDDTASQDFGPSTDGPVQYIDKDSDYAVRVLPGPPGLRIEFGSNKPGIVGDDVLTGGAGKDHLYGRAGDDTLEGKGGEDYLEGGSGNDTYIFNAGDGFNTIYDVSGTDRVQVHSGGGVSTLGGVIDSVPGSENLYEDSDGNRYAMLGNDLQITLFDGNQLDTDSKITVKEFTDGMLGINLNPITSPSAPTAPQGVQVFNLGIDTLTDYAWAFSPTVGGDTPPPYSGIVYDPHMTEEIFAQGSAAPVQHPFGAVIDGEVAGGLGDSYIQGDEGFNYLIDDLYSTHRFGTGTPTPVDWLLSDPVWTDLLRFHIGFFPLADQVGNDVMSGGGGDDWLYSHGGDDWSFGEDGNDLLVDNPGVDFGDNRWLALPGASSDDHLFGGNGNDILTSLQGDDYLDGGDDNDVLMSGQGDDTLAGGAGSDWLLADAALSRNELVLQPDGSYVTIIEAADEDVEYGKDTLFGDGGDDILAGGGDNDWLMGGSENDTLWGDGNSVLDENGAIQITVGDSVIAGNDELFGEQGDDVLLGGGGDDFLNGGDGNDQLEGDHADLDSAYHGNDKLFGGAGDDLLVGYGGNDALSGDAGNDQLWGEEGNDSLFGGDGVDMLSGGADNDVLSGGAGDDRLLGGAGDDDLFGDAGADRFDGGDGNDVLSGGSGDDEIYGSGGNDRLEGGSGIDSLFGGAGDDVYVFNHGSGQDVIVDTQGSNSVAFGAGVIPGSLRLKEVHANDGSYYLSIEYGSSGDRVFIRNGPLGAVSSISFADGTVLSFAELMAQSGLPLNGNGSEGDDIIQGGNAVDLLLGGAGNDVIHGGGDADALMGGSGDDSLNGDVGDDVLTGGIGNDELRGGTGSDSYLLHWGMGQDTLTEVGSDRSILQLDAGISRTDLALTHDGNDLLVQFTGVNDGVRIKDFALSSQLWELRNEDGTSVVIDDTFISANSYSAINDAATAIEAYQTRVESIFSATRGELGSVAGADGVFRRTSSTATSSSAFTEFFNEKFAVAEQVSDASSIARQSMAGYDVTRVLINQEPVSSAVLNVGVGQTTVDTSGGAFHPLTGAGAGTALPSGAVVINAFARPQDLDGSPLSFDVNDHSRPIGYWVFPDTTPGAQFTGLQFSTTQHYSYETNAKLTLERIVAGASESAISTSGYSVVDAGAGDDTVVVHSSQDSLYNLKFRVSLYDFDRPYDPRNLGSLLYGNGGNDQLIGGDANDILIGGEGDDFMDGASGADTYLLTAGDTGWDIIADTGGLPLHPETLQNRYQDWYFQSLGLDDWRQDEMSGQALPRLPQISLNDYAGIAQLASQSVLPTDSVEFGAGIDLSNLTISWGETVPQSPAQNEGGFSNPLPGVSAGGSGWVDAGSVHATLDISWAAGSGIRILMPHASPLEGSVDPGVLSYSPNFDLSRSDYFLGTGIEQFKFSDGTVVAMQEMLTLAPPPTLDPHLLDNLLEGSAAADMLTGSTGDDRVRGGAGSDVYIFNLGDGVDTIDDTNLSGDLNAIRFGPGIALGDLALTWTAAGLTIAVGTGGDAITLVNADPVNGDPSQVIETLSFIVFSEGGASEIVNIPLSQLLPPPPAELPGVQVDGTPRYDTLLGSVGHDSISGFSGNDTVFGGDGNDTITGGTGRDELYGEAGNDTFIVDGADRAYDIFNGGPGTDKIVGGAGDDIIRLRRFNARHSVETIDGGAGTNVIAGTRRRDTIDLSATVVLNIDHIDGGAGNDKLTGTGNDDLIIGGAGRDVLNGGAGNDTFRIGGTDSVYDTFNGGAGLDKILGGGGDDTIRLRSFNASHSVETIDGGAGTNVIAGTRRRDTIDLSATVVLNIDHIDGGAGNDKLTGTDNDDLMIGGAGRDVLNGGTGDDTYRFSRGDGRDTVWDYDTVPNTDRVEFGTTVAHDQLWFSQTGNGLKVQLIGTRDQITVKDWYLGSDRQIEVFQAGEGLSLLNTQVDQLVQAMAAFAPPASGETDLSPALRTLLEPVLAANWQAS